MNSHHIKKNLMSSFFWKFLERTGTQGIQFVVQIILARLLTPEQFGSIAIVLVFINLAQVFVQSGFSTALIQKKNADEKDFSSIFFLSIFIASIVYIIIFLVAPYIGAFYDDRILVPILRILALTLFTGAFNSIQNAYISRKMLFKQLFKSSLVAAFISGVCGIILAYQGAGIWALVVQQLVNQIIISIVLWYTVQWRPQLTFSVTRIKSLFSFGWKLLVSGFLDVFYRELRTLIIGRLYAPATLGYYNRGEQFPKLIVTNIDGTIQSVMLPTLSAHQDDKNRVKDMMRRAISTSSFFVFPLMMGLAVISEPFITLVLTEKWLSAVPFLQIFCVSYALMPIHSANLQAINAMGRSDIFLRLEIIKKILGIVILLISLPFGVYAIAIGQVINNILATFINAYPNKKLLNYSYIEQWLDLMPSLFISLTMGVAIYAFNFLSLQSWQKLILQIPSGVILYLFLSYIFKIRSLEYVWINIKQLLDSKNKTN